jgi:hypothetical protein
MPFTQVNIRPGTLFAGMAIDNAAKATDAYVNAEASQEMPFGTMLVQGTGDQDAKIATANTNKMIGVLRNQFAYAIARGAVGGELGVIGLKPKATLGVAKRGKMTVVVGEAVNPASPVRVRIDANAGVLGATNGPGTFCTTASAGHTVDISKWARFLNTVTGAGVVELEYDITMRANSVND